MLLKTCGRCGDMVKYPIQYCDACNEQVVEERKESERLSNRRYNQRRDPKYIRFYNSVDWRTLSQVYMQDSQYRCEGCNSLATEVHHIKPIQTDEGWLKRLDYNNLEAVCLDCHNERHGRFKRKTNMERLNRF